MEELADQLIGQIDRTAETGFNAALDELVRFHTFILEAQAITGDDGRPLNYAQVGGLWERPDQNWIRQYRRVFQAAANKIGEDLSFIRRLNNLILRLLPRNATRLSIEVMSTVLQVGIHEVLSLQAWFTKRTTIETREGAEASPRLVLAGSDSRAYEQAVISFVGGWENILAIANSLLDWKSAPANDPIQLWSVRAESWPFLRTHLHYCAYFVAAAVWNEDELGANRYRDMLLHWASRLRTDVNWNQELHRRSLLTPGWALEAWPDVEAFAVRLRRFPQPDPLAPSAVFFEMVRCTLTDVIVTIAAVTLAWYVREQQAGDIGARTANLLLNRRVMDGEGEIREWAGQPRSIFQDVLGFILRCELDIRPGVEKYSSDMGELVRSLNQMSARYVVPGRVYSGWGSDGVDSLRLELLAMLAAHFPQVGDDGARAYIAWIAADETLFTRGDQSVQNSIDALGLLARSLDEQLDSEAFARAVLALSPDADSEAARIRVRQMLLDLAAELEAPRLERLRAMEVDPAKVEALRLELTRLVRAAGPAVAPMDGFQVSVRDAANGRPRDFTLTGNAIEKGMFVTPQRSSMTLDQLSSVAADSIGEHFGNLIRAGFRRLPKTIVRVSTGRYPRNFWRTVASRANSVGPSAVLLVSGQIAQDLIGLMFQPQAAADLGVTTTYNQEIQGGRGAGYVGTVGSVDVFQGDLPLERALLFSSKILLDVIYERPVGATDFLKVDLSFAEGATVGELKITFIQEIVWADTPVVEFRLVAPRHRGQAD
jgi:hypothetical protein